MFHFRTAAVPLTLAAALAVCSGLSGCQTGPTSSQVAAEALRPDATPDILDARKAMAAEFRAFLCRVYPDYNDIRVDSYPDLVNGWVEFEGSHPFLSRYAFATGPQAGIIRAWVDANRPRFVAARVGGVFVSDGSLPYDNRYYFARKLYQSTL